VSDLTPENFPHKVIIVPVNKCWDQPGLSHYNAARYSWVVSPSRVQDVEYVMAVIKGEIVGVFKPDKWMFATKENFPEISDEHGNWGHQEWKAGHLRLGFRGGEAPNEIQSLYLGRHVSMKLRGQGVRYAGIK